MWDKDLSDDTVLTTCNCLLPSSDKPCKANLFYIPPYSKIDYSSTYGNYQVIGNDFDASDRPHTRLTRARTSQKGTYYAQGQLDAPWGWSSGSVQVGEWLQIDTGDVQTIMGVVTQGSRVHYWVTSFRVKVSDDKNSWKDVECGRIFDGNTDQNTKVQTFFDKPGTARCCPEFVWCPRSRFVSAHDGC